ncbi:MAG TPA: TIGR04552 family protein [Pseudomonadota bacterium]|jgi:uncharacterized protein (TIGR04552 family)|nr:TIGR04552 family protein [Pseudomonadota bacterium]
MNDERRFSLNQPASVPLVSPSSPGVPVSPSEPPPSGRIPANRRNSSVDDGSSVSASDLEAMRLLLAGSSVLDWHRLAFEDLAQVHRFLRLNEFDPDSPEDMERLEDVRADAVEYLTRHFGYRIPVEVAEGVPAYELLLLASRRARFQTYACIVLKVMSVLQHLDGREILFRLPVSDDQVFGLVETKVVRMVDHMRAIGLPIVEFAWSRKERDSLITKLLAKRDTLAAHVFDKIRFRLITRRLEDLPAVIRELCNRLIPWNYVIPGQSLNTLLPFEQIFEMQPATKRWRAELQADADINLPAALTNSFSASSYRVINFIADLPVRVGSILQQVGLRDSPFDPSGVVYVLTEFQVMDAQTALANEQGESSHAAYKERQHIQVKARLTRGVRTRPSRDGST